VAPLREDTGVSVWTGSRELPCICFTGRTFISNGVRFQKQHCFGFSIEELPLCFLFQNNKIIWGFSSSRKHLLITLLRLEFVVMILYFSIYIYLCGFNYSLFFVVHFLVFFCL
jgi:hypothetical protein